MIYKLFNKTHLPFTFMKKCNSGKENDIERSIKPFTNLPLIISDEKKNGINSDNMQKVTA